MMYDVYKQLNFYRHYILQFSQLVNLSVEYDLMLHVVCNSNFTATCTCIDYMLRF